jgi:hypothetical protein
VDNEKRIAELNKRCMPESYDADDDRVANGDGDDDDESEMPAGMVMERGDEAQKKCDEPVRENERVEILAETSCMPVATVDIVSEAPSNPLPPFDGSSVAGIRSPAPFDDDDSDTADSAPEMSPLAIGSGSVVVSPVPEQIPIDKPMEVVVEPMEVVAKSVEVVAKPVEVVAKPVEVVAKPVEVVAEPMEVVVKPVDMITKSVSDVGIRPDEEVVGARRRAVDVVAVAAKRAKRVEDSVTPEKVDDVPRFDDYDVDLEYNDRMDCDTSLSSSSTATALRVAPKYISSSESTRTMSASSTMTSEQKLALERRRTREKAVVGSVYLAIFKIPSSKSQVIRVIGCGLVDMKGQVGAKGVRLKEFGVRGCFSAPSHLEQLDWISKNIKSPYLSHPIRSKDNGDARQTKWANALNSCKSVFLGMDSIAHIADLYGEVNRPSTSNLEHLNVDHICRLISAVQYITECECKFGPGCGSGSISVYQEVVTELKNPGYEHIYGLRYILETMLQIMIQYKESSEPKAVIIVDYNQTSDPGPDDYLVYSRRNNDELFNKCFTKRIK